MKKLLLVLVMTFVLVTNVSAEVYSSETIEVPTGDTVQIDVNAIFESLGITENTVKKIYYPLSGWENNSFIANKDCDKAGDVFIESEEELLFCLNSTGIFNVTFNEKGEYLFKAVLADYTENSSVPTEYYHEITYKVLNYQDKEVSETIYANTEDTLTIKKSSENSMLGIPPEYLSEKLIVVDDSVSCDPNYTEGSLSSCKTNGSEYKIASFDKAGVYTIYEIYKIEKDYDLTTYVKTINVIVTDKVVVEKEVTETTLTNEGVINDIAEKEVLTSELIAPSTNKLNKITVNASEFVEAAKKDITLKYEIKEETGKLLYSWNFIGNKLDETTNLPMNLHLSVGNISETLEKEFTQENSLLITFSYSGKLPGEANVKIYVGDKYKSGDKLDFYYHNEKEGKVELIAKEIIVDQDGYVVVTIAHCSEYILNKVVEVNSDSVIPEDTTQNGLDDEPKMGDSNYNLIIYLSILVSVLSYYVLKIKVKN